MIPRAPAPEIRAVRPSVPPVLLEVTLIVAVLLAAFVLRVRFFGGFGLADDGIFWSEVKTIVFPSGEIVASASYPGWFVIRRTSLPSGFAVKISYPEYSFQMYPLE